MASGRLSSAYVDAKRTSQVYANSSGGAVALSIMAQAKSTTANVPLSIKVDNGSKKLFISDDLQDIKMLQRMILANSHLCLHIDSTDKVLAEICVEPESEIQRSSVWRHQEAVRQNIPF